jgi:hypothetical protein
VAAEDRVQEDPVVQPVDAPGGVQVELVGRVVGVGDGEVERDAELVVGAATAQLVHDQAVPQQQVVRGDEAGDALLPSRRVLAAGVAEERRAPRLVERRPRRDAVAERVVQRGGVLGEPVGGVAVGPAALVLERLGEVPVVERQPRADAGVVELVDETAVEVQPALVDGAGVGAHPVPGHREPVRRQAEVAHHRDVLGHPVVVVAGDVARVPVHHGAGDPAERVPDRRRAAVLGGGALDLVRRGGGAPEEPGREGEVASRPGGGADVEVGHPLTAPCMMPATSWRPVRMNRISSGMVASVVPARTRA